MDQRTGRIAVSAQIAVRRIPATRIDIRSALYLVGTGWLAIYFLIWPIWRAQFPQEIWLTEGWNAYLQDAAGSFQRLYPSASEFVGNNYPPLSFYTIGLLAKLFGDSLYVGRAISIIGLICVAAEIFLCARILTRTVIGPAIGALWYAAIMSHNSAIYVGANDPQIAGEAIMGASLVMFLRREADGRSAMPALLLMVLGGFWKHNMIAIPLTSIIWLLLRDRSKAIRPVLASFAAVAAGLSACGLLFGTDFFADMLAPRAYGWVNILANIGHLQWCAPALVIWSIWALSEHRSKAARLTSLHVSIGFGACILQWSGDGVGGSAEFDLILALGIGIGVTFSRVEYTWFARYTRAVYPRDAMVIVLLLRLVATERHETALLLFSPQFRAYFETGDRQVKAESAKVAAIPGNVACTNKLVCRLAGKPLVVDEFKTGELVATGRMSNTELALAIHSANISMFADSPQTLAGGDKSILHWVLRSSARP
jgi:hypothetical protein